MLDSGQIKEATKHFTATGQREVRILCKQDTRESRPLVFRENGLFILPVKNGKYRIIKGEGYVDIPTIDEIEERYDSKIDFQLVIKGVRLELNLAQFKLNKWSN